MRDHGVDPREFLDFVHDIDLARLTADPALVAALDRLPGRKFIFTNADGGGTPGACSAGSGLASNAFDGLHDIRHGLCAGPIRRAMRRSATATASTRSAPCSSTTRRNLARPRSAGHRRRCGSTTAPSAAATTPIVESIDYVAATLGEWLKEILGEEVE